MGRKPTRWKNLPRGMRARERGEKIYYFLDTGGKPRKEIPLGTDYVQAVQKWAELTTRKAPAAGDVTMGYVAERYFAEVVPSKAAGSQKSDEKEKVWVLRFFDDPPAKLDVIQPHHIKQFMRWRASEARTAAIKRAGDRPGAEPVPITYGQVRANRARSLISHMWNFAREEGITSLPNPCVGVHRFTEKGRDAAPDAEMVARVLAVADKPLQFAMRLADIIGQRPMDVRKISEADIKDGVLHVRQGKTQAKLRIEVAGELAVLLDEIRAYKKEIGGVRVLALLVNESGQPMRADAIRYRFDKARDLAGISKNDFQFRDFRAKAATETDESQGTKAAQALLGHTTEAMTAGYIRHKAGRKVSPNR